MGIYSKYILPRLLDRAMRAEDFSETRADVVGPASGTVLEIGFGSGFNLPFYKNIEKLYALEPSRELYELASERIDKAPFPVEFLQNSAEEIPLADGTIDTIVSTWTLCSIPDVPKTLKEIARVLKPSGRLIFVEHGHSPKKFIAAMQKLLTPFTRIFTGNCHLDREIDVLIAEAGFKIENLEKNPESGRPLMFSYRGTALVR